MSLPARGAWIEIRKQYPNSPEIESLPARGAWIEMARNNLELAVGVVAPREGSVD